MTKSIFPLLFLSSLILFHHSEAETPLRNFQALVVWNVGQGSWSTQLEKNACLHFDLGGEFVNLKRIQKLCKFRKQYLFISHWDWDHFSFLRKFISKRQDVCIKAPPIPRSLNSQRSRSKAWIKDFLPELPTCSSSSPQISVQVIFNPQELKNKTSLRSNDESIIFASSGFLFPGDSPSRMERQWMSKLPKATIKYLLVGHHGSKTSTSEDLLRQLPSLRGAIVSSRWGKYGHPHPSITERLQKRKIPILQTEKWGNIWFLL